MLSYIDKYPLALLMLTFEQREDVKKISDRGIIIGAKGEIKNIRRTKLVSQWLLGIPRYTIT